MIKSHEFNKLFISKFFKRSNKVLTNKKFLISGGTGFIGRNIIYTINIINLVFKTSIEIDIIIRNKKKIFTKEFYFTKNTNINFIYHDLSKKPLPLDKKYDYVIHLANNSHFEKTNSDIVYRNYLNFYKSVIDKKSTSFLLFSSGSVYENFHNKSIKSEKSFTISIKKTNKNYDNGKLICENHLKKNQNKFKKIVIFRGFTFIGPFCYSSNFFINELLTRIKNQKKYINITSNGKIYRSYIYSIEASCIIISSFYKSVNLIYNLGSDEYLDIKSVDKIINKDLNLNLKFNYLDTSSRPYPRQYYLPNVNLLKKDFNISKFIPLKKILKILNNLS